MQVQEKILYLPAVGGDLSMRNSAAKFLENRKTAGTREVCFLLGQVVQFLSENPCLLCGRQLAEPFNRHHLLPLSKGGKGTETVLLHKICHDKIHAVFSEMELKRHYHTIERLRSHQEMASFIKWVARKEPQYYDRSARRRR